MPKKIEDLKEEETHQDSQSQWLTDGLCNW